MSQIQINAASRLTNATSVHAEVGTPMLNSKRAAAKGMQCLKEFYALVKAFDEHEYGQLPASPKTMDYKVMSRFLKHYIGTEVAQEKAIYQAGMNALGYLVMSRTSGWVLF